MNILATDADGVNLRAVVGIGADLTLASRPTTIAAKLIDRQLDVYKDDVAGVSRVWLEVDDEEYEVDAAAVRQAAAEMLAEEQHAE